MSPERWLEALRNAPGIRFCDLPPEILMASSFLPGFPYKDPADRIVAATAREFGYTVMTRDKALLDYGSEGHLSVLAC
jgi:PIN domain nuclease of toxin-antitoxin system